MHGSESHRSLGTCPDNTVTLSYVVSYNSQALAQYLAVQWRNSSKAPVLPPSPAHTYASVHTRTQACTHVQGMHADTDVSPRWVLWQPTHACTRLTYTSHFIWCGKQGKQRERQFIHFLLWLAPAHTQGNCGWGNFICMLALMSDILT